ncbi:MAG: leucyl aminopeptidase [Hydrogenibacillus sp.]|nr:leucyl aminopeptidase [Hydrogenibacillus sp.]
MRVEVLNGKLLEVPADGLIVAVSEAGLDEGGLLPELDELLAGAVEAEWRAERITCKRGHAFALHTMGRIPSRYVIFVGIGERAKYDAQGVREAVAEGLAVARQYRLSDVLLCYDALKAPEVTPETMGQAIAEGAILGQYRFDGYRSKREADEAFRVSRLSVAMPPEVRQAVETGFTIGTATAEGVNLARTLTNTPANKLTPEVLAQEAVGVARRHRFEVEVLERADMERLGMGALLAVAQGSANAPRLVVMKYQGRETWDDVIAFVGKGITFDTGGISLKPAQNMESMIMDMGGAAAVIGAMEAIGRLRPKANILAVTPLVENMPDGRAYRPGDVLHSMSGKTIEVISTDAEGRLILADAITYAKRLGASFIVDLATLTGAVLVALGTQTTGAMTNDAAWWAKLERAAARAGERVWLLPSFDVYLEQIKSPVADLKNSGGRNAGTITAGMFLKAFVEETPWVHLDIAGTAWEEKGTALTPKGASGVMVRTLVELARLVAEEGAAS